MGTHLTVIFGAWALERAVFSIGNALVHRFAAFRVNWSWAGPLSLSTVHGWDVGAVEGTLLSHSNTGSRHGTTLEINWSGAVHHLPPAIRGGGFGAGWRALVNVVHAVHAVRVHGRGVGKQVEKEEADHPAIKKT